MDSSERGNASRRRDEGDLREHLIDLVFDASFLSLATSDVDGVPWCSPLEFVCDAALRVYWVSQADARHSDNLRANPKAAIAIYDSGQTPGAGMVDGLYAEGTVDELDHTEAAQVMPIIQRWLAWRDRERVEPRPSRAPGGESEWRLYRLKPTAWYALETVADPVSGPSDVRVSVDITDHFGRRYRSQV